MPSSHASEIDNKPAQIPREGLGFIDPSSADGAVSAESAAELNNGASEGESNGEEGCSSEDSEESILPRDRQRRTATYDYAYEKSMSHAEAKLFYQRHQLASKNADGEQQQQQQQRFVTPTQSVTPSVHGGNTETSSFTTGITSPRSNQGHVLPGGVTQTTSATALPPQTSWPEASSSL